MALRRRARGAHLTCGPTVVSAGALGNLRSYLLADWLKRLLLQRALACSTSRTSPTSATCARSCWIAAKTKSSPRRSARAHAGEIAQRYTDEFLRDEQCISILPADVFPRATDHVERMIEIAAALVRIGFAYEREGNVYFRVERFDGYGELGGSVSREGLRQGVRAEADR